MYGVDSMRREPLTLSFNVTKGTVISPGTFVWWNGTTLKQAGGLAANLPATWVNEPTSRRLTTSRFAGIADWETSSKDDFDKTFMVKSGAIYELACTSFTPKFGDLVGFEKDAGGNYLAAKTVQRVTHPYDAIGYVTKDYGAATTTVEVMILSAFDYVFRLRDLVQELALYADIGLYSAGGDLVTNYEFNTRAKVLALKSIVAVATTGASIATVKNGATSLQNTLTTAGGAAIGVVTRAELFHATDDEVNDVFDVGDADMDVALDATPTAGSATFVLEYMPMPLRV